MLAILLDSFLGIGAVLALAVMIGTWRQYAAAWDALAAERSRSDRVTVRHLTTRVISDGNCVRVPVAEIRTVPLVDRHWHERRAAA